MINLFLSILASLAFNSAFADNSSCYSTDKLKTKIKVNNEWVKVRLVNENKNSEQKKLIFSSKSGPAIFVVSDGNKNIYAVADAIEESLSRLCSNNCNASFRSRTSKHHKGENLIEISELKCLPN